MALEDNVAVLFTYGVQSDIATVATAGGTSQRMRRMPGAGLVGARDGQRSSEVRTDQQGADIMDGPRSCSGSLILPLATVACDDFLGYVLRNTWAAGAALDEGDFTSLAIASSVVTLGGGNPSTLGIRVGSIVDLANMSTAGNNGRWRVTAVTSTTFTIVKLSDGSAPTDQGADSDCDLTVVGYTLTQGTTKTALTIEQHYPNADVSELFKHCRLGGAQISLPPSGPCTMTVPVTGLDWENLSGGSAPYFSSVTAASETPVLEMAGGQVILNGTEYSVSGLDININTPLMPNGPLVGRETGTEIFYGVTTIGGNISFFLESAAQLNLFRSGTVIDFQAIATEAGGSFYSFGAQRAKLTGQQKTIGADGGVLLQSSWEAMKKSAATGYDATTLTIQRSNS
jgi:hypothetical protein